MSTLDRILDQGVALGEEERKLNEAVIEEVYRRDVSSRLDPLAEKARATIKEVRRRSPTVSLALAKVLKGPDKSDREVGPAIR